MYFLAIVRDMSHSFLYLLGIETCVKSPSKQSDGDSGTLQPKIVENYSGTVIQNE